MMWLSLFSDFVPNSVKGGAWLLWERRMFWRAARGVYKHDFCSAYFVLRLHENTRLLLIKCGAKS